MTSANGGNYAEQYPCDGWIDNLEPTPSMGRIPKLVPSSIDNKWRVQTPSNVPIERSQRDLPTPLLSLRVSPLVSDKNVSECCLIRKEKLSTGMRDLHAPLRKRHWSVEAPSISCELSSATFQSLGSYFFSDLIVFYFECFAKKRM